jgi:WD40 repeat protein
MNETFDNQSSEAASSASLEDEKRKREIEKIELEKDKLREEIRELKRPYLFRNAQLLTAAIASIGAVITLSIALQKDYFGMLVDQARREKVIADDAKKDADSQKNKADSEMRSANSLETEALEKIRQTDRQIADARQRVTTANEEADRALDEKDDAVRERNTAVTESLDAKEVSHVWSLINASIRNMTDDTDLAIWLGTYATQLASSRHLPILSEAQNQLHAALLASRLRYRVQGLSAAITAVDWRPDGNQIALGEANGEFVIVDASSGQTVQNLKNPNGAIHSVVWSSDGKHIAAAGDVPHVILWSTADWRATQAPFDLPSKINSLAWGPRSPWLLMGGDSVEAWNIESGEHRQILPGTRTRRERYVVSWAPNGRTIAVANTNAQILIGDFGTEENTWQAALRQKSCDFTGSQCPKDPILSVWGSNHLKCLSWNRFSTQIATSDGSSIANVWNAESGVFVRHLYIDFARGQLNCVQWNPQSDDEVATVGDSVVAWNVSSGQQIRLSGGHRTGFNSIAWSPDGQNLVTTNGDGSAEVWYASSVPRELGLIVGGGSRVLWQKDGKAIFTENGKGVWKWNVEHGTNIYSIPVPGGFANNHIIDVDLSPDGRTIATAAGPDYRVVAVDAANGEQGPTLETESNTAAIRWSPDGRKLLAAHSLIGFDISLVGSDTQRFTAKDQFFTSVAWSSDGKSFVSASRTTKVGEHRYEGSIDIWTASTGALLKRLSGDSSSVDWSSDNQRIAAAQDNAVNIYDSKSLTLLKTCEGQKRPVSAIAWSHHSNFLALGDTDGNTIVCDPFSGGNLVVIPSRQGSVQSLTWSADDTLLASSGSITQIYAIDLRSLLFVARSRVTRVLNSTECTKYLQTSSCPSVLSPNEKTSSILYGLRL